MRSSTAQVGTLGWGGQGASIADIRRAAAAQERVDLLPMLAGQGAGLAGEPQPAAEIVAVLLEQTARGSLVSAPVDLAGAPSGVGPLWGMQSEELNATLLEWPPGGGVAEHVNDELEVLVLVLAGSASVSVDGTEHQLAAGGLLLVPRGCARSVPAGREGVRYLSVHRRRGPLLPRPRIGLFDA